MKAQINNINFAGLRHKDIVNVISISNTFPIIDRLITIQKSGHEQIVLHNKHVILINNTN